MYLIEVRKSNNINNSYSCLKIPYPSTLIHSYPLKAVLNLQLSLHTATAKETLEHILENCCLQGKLQFTQAISYSAAFCLSLCTSQFKVVGTISSFKLHTCFTYIQAHYERVCCA